MVFAIAVAPAGTEIAMPPWAPNLPELGAADGSGQVPGAGDTISPDATGVTDTATGDTSPVETATGGTTTADTTNGTTPATGTTPSADTTPAPDADSTTPATSGG